MKGERERLLEAWRKESEGFREEETEAGIGSPESLV